MPTLFTEDYSGEVLAGLRGIGYHHILLKEDYKLPDYFTSKRGFAQKQPEFMSNEIMYLCVFKRTYNHSLFR